jgi:hypothetical protein
MKVNRRRIFTNRRRPGQLADIFKDFLKALIVAILALSTYYIDKLI